MAAVEHTAAGGRGDYSIAVVEPTVAVEPTAAGEPIAAEERDWSIAAGEPTAV